MNEPELFKRGAELLTVKQISEQTRIPIPTIHRIASKLYPNKKENGKTAFFNEQEVTELIKEVKRAHNSELISSDKVITTDLEMYQRIAGDMAWLHSKVLEQQKQIDRMTPKELAFDNFIRSDEQRSITDAAKHFGVRQGEAFSILRTKGFLTKDDLPTAKAIQFNCLMIRETQGGWHSDGRPRFVQQAVIGPNQMDNFRKILGK